MRTSRSVIVAALLLALAIPATAAVGAEGELDETRGRLDEARRTLTELEESVRRTGDEVAMLDDRLRIAATELAAVVEELADAEDALEDARGQEAVAGADLATADAALDDALDRWRTSRDQLQARAIHTYKYGGSAPHELLVRGVTGADDWHEITVTLETVARLAEDDRQLVESSLQLTRETTVLRADAGSARAASVAATNAARREERRVAELVAAQERLVADIDAELAERGRVLAELEADAEARAVLVAQLERRVAELEQAALRVLIPVQADLDVYGPPPDWSHRLPSAGQAYAAAFEAIGARHGIDGRLIAALVWAESNFRADAVSRAGALGLSQLMPGTAQGLGVDPRDPIQNLEGGTRYLRTQLDRFGRVDLALAAYNAGPGRVERAGPGIPNIVETQLYVVRVLDYYEQLGG